MESKIAKTPLLVMSLAFCWITNLSGCSIAQLQHDDLQEPAQRRSGNVNLGPKATGFTEGRVGWGRVTLFSIPVVPIRIHSDEASDLMVVVRDALAIAGYAAHFVDNAQPGPVLKAHVDEVRFNNYTWVAPLVPTWGRLHVTLRLESADGPVLWEKSFESSGHTYNFTDGYNIAATRIVTKLANSMVEAFGSQEFSNALSGGG